MHSRTSQFRTDGRHYALQTGDCGLLTPSSLEALQTRRLSRTRRERVDASLADGVEGSSRFVECPATKCYGPTQSSRPPSFQSGTGVVYIHTGRGGGSALRPAFVVLRQRWTRWCQAPMPIGRCPYRHTYHQTFGSSRFWSIRPMEHNHLGVECGGRDPARSHIIRYH